MPLFFFFFLLLIMTLLVPRTRLSDLIGDYTCDYAKMFDSVICLN